MASASSQFIKKENSYENEKKIYIALLFYKNVFCYFNSLKTSFIVLFCIYWTWLSESILIIKN